MTQYDEPSFDAIGSDVEDPADRVERVRRCELPNTVNALVSAYDETVGVRDGFLWKWLYFVFPSVTLSCVDSAYEERVRDEKLIVSLFVVLLDDVAEQDMDRETFEELAKVPFEHQEPLRDREGVNAAYVEFAEDIWERLDELLAEAPRRTEYESLFDFDVKQNVNAIDYSYILNQYLEMANVAESDAYDSNNMMLYTYVNIDLMHSPSFDRGELSQLRRVVWNAQKMARVGNWVSTWKREIREHDYSSGIVIYALENGIVDREELYKLSAGRYAGSSEDIVRRIEQAGVEEVFLDKWHQNYEEVQQLKGRIETTDVDSFLSGMEKLMSYHLATKGLK